MMILQIIQFIDIEDNLSIKIQMKLLNNYLDKWNQFLLIIIIIYLELVEFIY